MERSKIQNIVPVTLLVVFGCGVLACGRTEVIPPPPVEVETTPEPEKPLEDVTHTVSISGETLGLIARWYSGDSSNWVKIKDANPGLVPERLKIGQQIQIPSAIVVRREAMTADFVKASFAKKGMTDATVKSREADIIPEDNHLDGGVSGSNNDQKKSLSNITKSDAIFPTVSDEGMKEVPDVVEPVSNDAESGAVVRDPDYREDVERQKLLRELLGGK